MTKIVSLSDYRKQNNRDISGSDGDEPQQRTLRFFPSGLIFSGDVSIAVKLLESLLDGKDLADAAIKLEEEYEVEVDFRVIGMSNGDDIYEPAADPELLKKGYVSFDHVELFEKEITIDELKELWQAYEASRDEGLADMYQVHCELLSTIEEFNTAFNEAIDFYEDENEELSDEYYFRVLDAARNIQSATLFNFMRYNKLPPEERKEDFKFHGLVLAVKDPITVKNDPVSRSEMAVVKPLKGSQEIDNETPTQHTMVFMDSGMLFSGNRSMALSMLTAFEEGTPLEENINDIEENFNYDIDLECMIIGSKINNLADYYKDSQYEITEVESDEEADVESHFEADFHSITPEHLRLLWQECVDKDPNFIQELKETLGAFYSLQVDLENRVIKAAEFFEEKNGPLPEEYYQQLKEKLLNIDLYSLHNYATYKETAPSERSNDYKFEGLVIIPKDQPTHLEGVEAKPEEQGPPPDNRKPAKIHYLGSSPE